VAEASEPKRGTKEGAGEERFPLTPFVSTLKDEVRRTLALFIGVKPEQVIRFTLIDTNPALSSEVACMALELSPGNVVVVDVLGKSPNRPFWFQTEHFSFGYQKADENTDFEELAAKEWLRGFKPRMEGLDGEDSSAELDLVLGALQAYRPFEDLRDHDFRQLVAGDVGYSGHLRLGFRCNQDCHFCWQDRDWPEPPSEFYTTWLDEMAGYGIDELVISGGEPTIHKALPDIVARAVTEHGLIVTLETNAIRLGKENYRNQLIEAGLKNVFVSYHSQDANISDTLTRAPGTHVGTVAGIKACVDSSLNVFLNCVVQRENVHDLPAHARFIASEFRRADHSADAPSVKRVTYSFPSAYWDLETYTRSIVPLDEVSEPLTKAIRTLYEQSISTQVLGTCGFPPCVIKQEEKSLWFCDRDELEFSEQANRVFGDVCSQCVIQANCLGVRKEYLDVYGDRGLRPFDKMPRLLETRPPSGKSAGVAKARLHRP
jgi:sulfatase maturation enzyme AslB (radical SAM superfamily)